MTFLKFSISPWITSKICTALGSASSKVSLSSLCSTALTSLFPKTFILNISASCWVEGGICKDNRPTQLSLPGLFCCYPQRRDQPYQCLDNHFGHGFRGSNFRIDIDAQEKVRYELDEVDKSIVARSDVFNRLHTWTSQGSNKGSYGDTYCKEGPNAGIYCLHKCDRL